MIRICSALCMCALILVGSSADNSGNASLHLVGKRSSALLIDPGRPQRPPLPMHLTLVVSERHGNAEGGRQSPLLRLGIVDVGKVSPRWNATVRRSLERVGPRIESDLHVTMPRLMVRIYGNRPLFSRALEGADGLRPAGSWDTAGNVVDDGLVLGPALSWSEHRLAHIIAEWIFDRLTHNVTDSEPRPAWLYDGLAEVEAQRVVPSLTCLLHDKMPLPLQSLAAPRQWLSIRNTSLIWLEYCEALVAAGHVIARIGWVRLVSDMHHASSWAAFAHGVGVDQ